MAQQSELEFLLEVGAKMSSSYQKVMKQASDALKQMGQCVRSGKDCIRRAARLNFRAGSRIEHPQGEVRRRSLEKGKIPKLPKRLKRNIKSCRWKLKKTGKSSRQHKSAGRCRGFKSKGGKRSFVHDCRYGKSCGGRCAEGAEWLAKRRLSVFGLSASTRDYRTNAAKLSVTMAANGYSADYTAEAYKSLYGYLGDDQTVTTTLSNLSQMKLEQGDLNTLISSMQGVWAAYGDSIPLDGLAESVNETAKTRTVTGNLADALNWPYQRGNV